jgi:hypothetical protein
VIIERIKWRSFLRGVWSLLDFSGSLHRREFLERSDAEALANDWKAVGDDLRRAMKYEKRGGL